MLPASGDSTLYILFSRLGRRAEQENFSTFVAVASLGKGLVNLAQVRPPVSVANPIREIHCTGFQFFALFNDDASAFIHVKFETSTDCPISLFLNFDAFTLLNHGPWDGDKLEQLAYDNGCALLII